MWVTGRHPVKQRRPPRRAATSRRAGIHLHIDCAFPTRIRRAGAVSSHGSAAACAFGCFTLFIMARAPIKFCAEGAFSQNQPDTLKRASALPGEISAPRAHTWVRLSTIPHHPGNDAIYSQRPGAGCLLYQKMAVPNAREKQSRQRWEPYMENASQLPLARLSRTPSLVSEPFLYTSIANHAAGSHG